MNAVRTRLFTMLVAVCLLSAAFAVALAGVAQGAVTHRYISTPITEIPAKGPPPAEEPIADPGSFSAEAMFTAEAMTVDSGDLYLSRKGPGGSFVDKFNASTSAFVAQFPQLSEPYSNYTLGLAVGHGAGETQVYVGTNEFGAKGARGRVAVYDAAGHLVGTPWTGSDTPAGHFDCFECSGDGSVAADDSPNPLTEGRVYVVDPEHEVVDVFEPKAGGGEKYITEITGPEPSVPFSHLGAPSATTTVAVDQLNGDVLVMEGTTVVDVFELVLGEYVLVRRLTGTPAGAFEQVRGMSTDPVSGDIYVLDAGPEGVEGRQGNDVVDQFSSAGVYLGHLTSTTNTPAGTFGALRSVAVAPETGDIYIGDTQQNLSLEFSASVHLFGPSIVVPDVQTEPATSVKPHSATLSGTVNPDKEGSAKCHFEWGTSASFGREAACEPETVPDGENPESVHAALTDLRTDTTYYYRLAASNNNGPNPGEAFQTRQFSTPGPGVSRETVSTVTSASATLGALIDPNNAPTTYYFQYGPTTAYGSSLPAQPGLSLGSGKGDGPVSVHLQGLAAGTVYHYRVVALSEVEGEPVSEAGSDQTFTTQATGTEAALPDGRQWEMVSPPNKHGADIDPQSDVVLPADVQAAANGGGITYGADSPIVPNPAGNRAIEATQVISTRRAPGSWESADLETPHEEGGGSDIFNRSEYKLFTSDLSVGVLEPSGDTPLGSLLPGEEATVYLRGANGEYKATVTSASLQSPSEKLHVPGGLGIAHTVTFVGASLDLNHLVVESEVALVPNEPAYVKEGSINLYEWSTGGKLQLVSVLPDGEPAHIAYLGTPDSSTREVRNAVSSDGSRVVFGQTDSPEEQVQGKQFYLRDTVKDETILLNKAEGMPQPRKMATHYRAANNEDSRIFFTSTGRLTPNSTASGNTAQEETAGYGVEDLYVFEVTSGKSEPLAGKLTDLSIDPNAGETADVLGVIGTSEDGSYVYFVASGVLGDASEHGAVYGHNLYVVHYDEATKTWAPPKFVAALAGTTRGGEDGDAHDWTSAFQVQLPEITARVSPNGRFLAFMSENSLTGYDNRDANSGEPDEEVFLYDAGTGRLVCASCSPTGARPVGFHEGIQPDEPLVDWAKNWQDRWLAGSIPGWTAMNQNSLYQPRYLSNDGRLFFESNDALVPADVNGGEDVYEYEPGGVGSCRPPGYGQSASVVYREAVGGCVGLISAGTSSEESAFMDASESGGDVFFVTLSKLSPRDYDNSLDIYDAHECTASAPCAPPPALTPPPCTTGDACKPGPTPQPTLYGEPSSETFSGAGNIVPSIAEPKVTKRSSGNAAKLAKALKACRKRPERERAGCERQARRRFGAKQAGAGKGLSAGTRR